MTMMMMMIILIKSVLTEIFSFVKHKALIAYESWVLKEVYRNHFFQQQDQLLLNAFLLKNYSHQQKEKKKSRQVQQEMFHLLVLMNSVDYWDLNLSWYFLQTRVFAPTNECLNNPLDVIRSSKSSRKECLSSFDRRT